MLFPLLPYLLAVSCALSRNGIMRCPCSPCSPGWKGEGICPMTWCVSPVAVVIRSKIRMYVSSIRKHREQGNSAVITIESMQPAVPRRVEEGEQSHRRRSADPAEDLPPPAADSIVPPSTAARESARNDGDGDGSDLIPHVPHGDGEPWQASRHLISPAIPVRPSSTSVPTNGERPTFLTCSSATPCPPSRGIRWSAVP